MALSQIQNILAISVHPDDEAFGCAGTLLKYAAKGAHIYWGIVTDAKTEYGFPEEFAKNRVLEIEKVKSLLNIKKTLNLGLKPASLTANDLTAIINGFGTFIKENKIDTIFCVNRSDAHSDHRVTFQACATFIKSFRYPTIKNFFSYECISETEFAPPLSENIFIPNVYFDITNVWDKKMQVIQIYKSELAEHPFPRSLKAIEAQAVLRGAYAGYHYAEAFQALKICCD